MRAETLFKSLPTSLLKRMYHDQRKALKAMGVDVPSHSSFNLKLPLWRKVILLDWLLREALRGEDGFKEH